MTSFILERKVDCPELHEALAQFRQGVGAPLNVVDPSVVLLTKRMARRVGHVEEKYPELIAQGLSNLVAYKSPEVACSLGSLSLQGGKKTGVERCAGFPMVMGDRRGKHPKQVLLDERARLASSFGIKLYADEKEKESLIVPAFRLKDLSLDERNAAMQFWHEVTGGRTMKARLLNLSITPLSEK